MTQPMLLSKLVGETITVTFNFAEQMQFGETIPSVASVAVTVWSGVDNSPSSILTGPVTPSGTTVSTKVTLGRPGVIYSLRFHGVGSTGAIYYGTYRLAVLSDTGSYVPSSVPSLTGDLPDGVVGAAYSADLVISGGYMPYAPDGVASGTAPAWMGFSVADATLTCAGTPDESAPTSYTFAPQIADAALTNASSNQTINVTRTVVAGDLGNLEVGQTVSGFTYTASNGTAPYTYAIVGGALPTGLSLASNGSVTGTTTTEGSFSWTIRGTDANGITDDHDDSALVTLIEWLATFATFSGNTMETSLGLGNWTNPPFTATGWSPGIGTESAKNGTAIVFLFNGTSMYSANGSSYITTGFSAGTPGHGAVYLSGFWYWANVAGVQRSSDGKSFATPAGAVSSNSLGKIQSRLLSVRHAGDPGVVWSCDDGAATPQVWTNRGTLPNAFNPSAQTRIVTNDVNLASILLVENGNFGGGAGTDRRAHILVANNPFSNTTISWTEAPNPFPDILDQSVTTYGYYAPDQAMFVYIFGNRLAYGPSPTSLTLSAHVFSVQPTHITSSASAYLVCGGSGLLESSVDLETWTPQVIGGTPTLYAVASRPD